MKLLLIISYVFVEGQYIQKYIKNIPLKPSYLFIGHGIFAKKEFTKGDFLLEYASKQEGERET